MRAAMHRAIDHERENAMPHRAWTVRLRGREIDIVFFEYDCDASYVYRALVDHDGYDPSIKVTTNAR